MTFVENKRKELKTAYIADHAEIGEEMGLLPEGKNGIKVAGKIVYRYRVGIG